MVISLRDKQVGGTGLAGHGEARRTVVARISPGVVGVTETSVAGAASTVRVSFSGVTRLGHGGGVKLFGLRRV